MASRNMSQVEKYLYGRVAELDNALSRALRAKDGFEDENKRLLRQIEAMGDENQRLQGEMEALQEKHQHMMEVINPKVDLHSSNAEEHVLEEQTRQLRLVIDVIERHELIEATMAEEICSLKQQIDDRANPPPVVTLDKSVQVNTIPMEEERQENINVSVIPELKDEFFQHFESFHLEKMLKAKETAPIDLFQSELQAKQPSKAAFA